MDLIEEVTPVRGTIRKFDERTPDSDSSDSPDKKKVVYDINDLKMCLLAKIDSVKDEIQKECHELKAEICELRAQVTEKTNAISDLENNVVMLSNELDKANARVDVCESKITDLENKLEESEQYSRRTSLRFSGDIGPLKPGDDYRQLVVDLANQAGIPLDKSEVDRAHPVGKDSKQLIAKFTSYESRRKLYSNKKKFKNVKQRRIYVNEDLTNHRHGLLKQLIELRKRKVIDNVWTLDGRSDQNTRGYCEHEMTC